MSLHKRKHNWIKLEWDFFYRKFITQMFISKWNKIFLLPLSCKFWLSLELKDIMDVNKTKIWKTYRNFNLIYPVKVCNCSVCLEILLMSFLLVMICNFEIITTFCKIYSLFIIIISCSIFPCICSNISSSYTILPPFISSFLFLLS